MPIPSPRDAASLVRRTGPGSIVSIAAAAWWRHWPALIAILLAGAIARELFIRGSGFAATIDPIWGMLLMPLIVLSRLAAIVAMLLVVRQSMPSYTARLAAVVGPERRQGRFRDVLAGSIVAFFVIYAAWDLVVEDQTEYTASYLEQVDWFALPEGATADPFALGLTWITASIVVVAFVLRLLLKRFASRLPSAAGFVSVYLEAVWVLVAVIVVKAAFEFLPSWLETRRIVVWAVETWDDVLVAVAPLRWVWDAWGWIWAQGVDVVIIPLAWLTLVGIIYANSIPSSEQVVTTARPVGFRQAVVFRARGLGADLLERWTPIAQSARTIWRAGPITMGFTILLIAVVAMMADWTDALVFRIIAPQEIAFWLAADRAIALVAAVIWEPIRICVLAAAFDYCVGTARPESPRQGSKRSTSGAASNTESSTAPDLPTSAGTIQVNTT
jgi:hypothetical protein